MIRREFINVDGQEVHFRIAGNGPPIVLLHDSPRSSVLHLPQLEHFADEFTVIALDTPGYGNSAPLPREPRPEIGDFADSLAATLTALAIEHGEITAEEGWSIAHLDEDWNIEQWGEDFEAAARRASRRQGSPKADRGPNVAANDISSPSLACQPKLLMLC